MACYADSVDSSPEDLRRWVAQRNMAAAREKAALRDQAPDPTQAMARGLALFTFASQLQPSYTRTDGVPAEDIVAYERWARLRSALLQTDRRSNDILR